MIKVYIQISCKKKNIPHKKTFKKWIYSTIKKNVSNAIITIYIVKKKKMIELNKKYRNIKKNTNILSFNLGKNKKKNQNVLIGDLVICKKKVEKEAKKYKLKLTARWAHLTIHGILHLLNYKHNTIKNYKKMKKIEIQKMKSFGFFKKYYKNMIK
ncbi:rRNA maturation RNase YbeY [Buchnera aphidicola]|uniref:rRNA maturation RNase YbeY n=1 Tax=Buchnera aphidicola TaxID=9 RepID=UPI0030EB2FF5